MVTRFVEYTRVSTKSQDYGIDAQKMAISGYVAKVKGFVIASFTEKESGKKNNRIELTKAIEYCKLHNATLIVAKLDRLSRDLVFIMQLHNSKLDFVVVDNPNLNTLTIGIFATVAQHERETISTRVKEALKVVKVQGLKTIGKPKGLKCSAKDKKNKGVSLKTHHSNRITTILEYLDKNATIHNNDLAIMVKLLNSNGYKTRQGNEFNTRSVKNLLKNKATYDKKAPATKRVDLATGLNSLVDNSNIAITCYSTKLDKYFYISKVNNAFLDIGNEFKKPMLTIQDVIDFIGNNATIIN